MCSRLRECTVVDRELNSILNAAVEFNASCESRCESIQSSLGEGDLNEEQITTLERNYQNLKRSKELAVGAIDNTDDPKILYEMVMGHVDNVSMQMGSFVTGGFDDFGLSEEGVALRRHMNSYSKLKWVND